MLFDQQKIGIGMHFISQVNQPRTFFQQLRFWGTIAGYMTPIVTLLSLLWSKVIAPVFKRIKGIYDTVGELAINHIPHIQASLTAQDVVLAGLKRDVESTKTDVQSTKAKVDSLEATVALMRKPHARRKQ